MGMGTPQFYGFAEIDMDYSQEPSEVKRDRKKRKVSVYSAKVHRLQNLF